MKLEIDVMVGGWIAVYPEEGEIVMRVPRHAPTELSLNRRRGRGWQAIRRVSNEWKDLGWTYGRHLAGHDVGVDLPLGSAVIAYDLNFKLNRGRDDDNFASPTMKPFRDGLVKAGVFVDDTPDHLTEGVHTLGMSGIDEVYVHIQWGVESPGDSVTERVIELRAKGMSLRQIAKREDVSHMTVQRIVKNWNAVREAAGRKKIGD